MCIMLDFGGVVMLKGFLVFLLKLVDVDVEMQGGILHIILSISGSKVVDWTVNMAELKLQSKARVVK